MNEQQSQLLNYAKGQLELGFDAAKVSQDLLQAGWNPEMVDWAIAEASVQSQLPSQSIHHKKSMAPVLFGLGLFVLVGVAAAAAAGYFLLLPSSSDSAIKTSEPQQTEVFGGLDSGRVVSDDGSISFNYPADWVIEQFDTSSGKLNWSLDPPDSDAIAQQLTDKYGLEPGVDLFSDGQPTEEALQAMQDPLWNEGAAVTVNVSENQESPEEFEAYFELFAGTEGVTIEDREDLTISGFPAFKYRFAIETQADAPFATQVYTILADDQKVEISLFPADSTRKDEFQRIVDSLELKSQ